MKQVILLITLCLTLSVITFGQDPTKAAPDSYKLQFENEWLRVLRVHYAAKQKVPVHDHSKGPAMYVYLNDSGPIRFTHTDWDHPLLVRQAVKAKSFRLSPTRFDNETHSVENPNDTASDFLRIELRTEAPDRASLSGRFAPDQFNRSAGLRRKVFENSQLRITRLSPPDGQVLTVTAESGRPSLVIAVAAGLSGTANVAAGDSFWLGPGEKRSFESNKLSAPIELLKLDLITGPQGSRGASTTAMDMPVRGPAGLFVFEQTSVLHNFFARLR